MAGALGLRVERGNDGYAYYDGKGTIHIAPAEDLDDTDTLAQLIFHELCHALIAWPDGLTEPDWGLHPDAREEEYASLVLQCALASRHGLRAPMRPTTEHGSFYDSLPRDPLEARPADATRGAWRARRAHARSEKAPWSPHLHAALSDTARLWCIETPKTHPTGRSLFHDDRTTCGRCHWWSLCSTQHPELATTTGACERFDAHLHCHTCAACCREGFDVVEVQPWEPAARFATPSNGRHTIARPNGICSLLAIDRNPRGSTPTTQYHCQQYDTRPRACRELEPGSEGCLVARQRIGLTR